MMIIHLETKLSSSQQATSRSECLLHSSSCHSVIRFSSFLSTFCSVIESPQVSSQQKKAPANWRGRKRHMVSLCARNSTFIRHDGWRRDSFSPSLRVVILFLPVTRWQLHCLAPITRDQLVSLFQSICLPVWQGQSVVDSVNCADCARKLHEK